MLKKFLFVLGCAITFYGTAKADVIAVRDSVGVTQQNGKMYITHKVEPKETLYGLSRKYGVPVAQIIEVNKGIDKTMTIGQLVLVPIKGGKAVPASTAVTSAPKSAPVSSVPANTTPASTATGKTFVVDGSGNKVHTVQARQTLYSISRMYGVSIENIKSWNNLPGNSVSIGDSLIVGKGAAGATQVATKSSIYVPEHDEEVTVPKQAGTTTTSTPRSTTTSTPVTATAPKPATTAPSTAPVSTPVTKPATETASTSSATKTSEYTSRVNESGMAEQIDQNADSKKFLALHKTAPVGTIMAVRNPSNDQTVYVRVIGKLPNTGDNEKVIVKLSKKACQQIGVTDKRFPVEVSYMP